MDPGRPRPGLLPWSPPRYPHHQPLLERSKMKILTVSVTYGELRSTGYPAFSNTRHEVMFAANLEPGETARSVMENLQLLAKREVKKAFGDNVENTHLDLPF
jgi:hypothetical protein